MNRKISRNTDNTNSFRDAAVSFPELIQEMKLLDMDPKPLLEIAANDIFSLHGGAAIILAELMLDQMYQDDNPDGIYLWKELCCILGDLFSTPEITLH